MKKVLAFVGSPRRGGNTDLLIHAVLAGARENGHETGLVYLADQTIRECDGCHACWREKPCPKQDDMNGLYQAISDSDTLVFGTPVYWYGPTALMKLLIDRFVYFNCPANRRLIRGKPGLLVVPFEEEDPETVRPVLDFFAQCFAFLEMRPAGQLVVPGVTRRGAVAADAAVMRQALELGKNLVF